MNALIRPRTIAVIGASPNRETLGNVALDNLANYEFAGRVIPVHGEATEIAGLAAVSAIEALPDDVDVALASVPAAGVADVVRRLDSRGVRTAIVNTAGFSDEQEAELRLLVNSSRILMHGPNCMGLINLSDATPIYTGGITSRVRKGPVALIAQSGSAAISVINSSTAGFSKIVTIGSEYRVTGADYLRLVRGRRRHVGGRAGARIDPGRRPVRRRGRPRPCRRQVDGRAQGRPLGDRRARDAGAHRRADPQRRRLQGLRRALWRSRGRRLRGVDRDPRGLCREQKRPARGEVAPDGHFGRRDGARLRYLREIDLPLAEFSEATGAALRAALPGIPGQNPLDIGQSVGRQAGAALAGMTAVMTAEEVGIGVVLQDMQASLPASSHRNYTVHLATVAELSRNVDKPIVVISPTAEIMSESCSPTSTTPACRRCAACGRDWSR